MPPPSEHFPCPQLVSISPRAAPGPMHGYAPCPCQEQPSRLSSGNTVFVAWCSLLLFIQIFLPGVRPMGLSQGYARSIAHECPMESQTRTKNSSDLSSKPQRLYIRCIAGQLLISDVPQHLCIGAKAVCKPWFQNHQYWIYARINNPPFHVIQVAVQSAHAHHMGLTVLSARAQTILDLA